MNKNAVKTLGIESSCDETAVAIYDSEQGLLSHALYSQIEMHAQYGGVVPELASRDHSRKIVHLVKQAMEDAHCGASELDVIAYTAGPGLIGALLVGSCFARSLAYAWNKPTVAVHHMEAHLLAPMLEASPPQYPFVALVVSGGHTLLVAVEKYGHYQLLGETLDDAAGEAFDKTAKLLGLPYPGGPELAKLALDGDSAAYRFPRPMVDRPGLDFSFSGLKTFALNTWNASDQSETTKANVARAFEDAVVDTLLIKCKRAMAQTHYQRLVIAGGVGANKHLRQALHQLADKLSIDVFFPRPEFCTDNAAMVAYAGNQQFIHQGPDEQPLKVYPRWPLGERA